MDRALHEDYILVLQGGGALGAYQAGVFEALSTHGLTPNWVTGISIGAINAALLAASILAIDDPLLAKRLDGWRAAQTEKVLGDEALSLE